MPASDQRSTAQRISQLHAIDHLMRLRNRLQEPILSHDVIEREVCAPTLLTLKKMIERARNGLAEQRLQIELTSLAHEAEVITAHALEARGEVLRSNAAGSQGHSSEALLRVTDTLRWLERTAQHIWRISYYLQQEKPENLANQSKS
jgi:phosphate:Na+ symporter